MLDPETLSSPLRRVWDLRVEGLSVEAIAERLGEPEGRVRWQLGRAMGLLDRRDPLGVLSKRAR